VTNTNADTVKTRPAKKKSWSAVIVFAAILVIVAGGFGGLAITNSIATSRYADVDGVGSLSIPRLGADFAIPIVAGTSLKDLRQGVGWYDGTAPAGQIGNFALTGHRLGWGQPFADLGSLQVGDEIQVTTDNGTFIYHVITGPTVVSDKETDVLAAVPGDPDRTPNKALITLITAASWLPSPDRIVVIGELAD